MHIKLLTLPGKEWMCDPNYNLLFSFVSVCPSTGSFEIEINGQLVFSKLELKGFPIEDEVSLSL